MAWWMPPVKDPAPILRDFAAQDERLSRLYDALLDSRQQGEVTGPEFAEAIERMLLPPWRIESARVESMPRPSGRLKIVVRYVQAKREAWELRAKWGRTGDPADAAAAEAREAEVVRLVGSLEAR